MLPNEFLNEMKRLIETFGEKNFGETKKNLIFKKFKIHDVHTFGRAIDWLILNKRSSPIDSDFVEALDFVQWKKADGRTPDWKEMGEKSQVSPEFFEKWIKPFIENRHKWSRKDHEDYADMMEKEIKYKCKFCENDGFIHAYSLSDQHRFIFYCSLCDAGKKMAAQSKNTVFWEDRFSHAYEVRRKGL